MRRLLASFAIVMAAPYVHACKCVHSPPPAQALREATAVFVGVVADIIKAPDSRTLHVILQVKRYWKGASGGTVMVLTKRFSSACGFPFRRGQEYLVYATGENGDLHTGRCSRTTASPGSEAEQRLLGEPRQPK